MPVSSVNITFDVCDPAPANGYNIQWRVAETGSPYTDAGNFSGSPASIPVSAPEGSDIEGIIRGDCGGGIFGPSIPWTAPAP